MLFRSGFIAQFVQGATLEDCQRYGNMTGAVNTTAAGGTTALMTLPVSISIKVYSSVQDQSL